MLSPSQQAKIGAKDIKLLYQPSPHSHKGDNGKLLIIAGSQKYHGALFLAAKIASKIVDLVYISSIPENNQLIKKLKSDLAEFITVSHQEIDSQIKDVDCVLIGPGLGVSQSTEKLVNNLLKRFPEKKFILDADALKVVDKKLLNEDCIITPHRQEFKTLFGQSATQKSVKAMARKYGCIIVLKGQTDFVISPNQFKINKTGNAGMTKGGTGDVLAGLISALACKNNLFLSACVGVYLNGLAGDRLKKKVSYYYNASDLVEEIPKVMKRLLSL